MLLFVRSYQTVASPIFGGACRFEPSCSSYAVDALKSQPPFRALVLIITRLLKCRPGGPSGYDPIPLNCQQCGGSHGSKSR